MEDNENFNKRAEDFRVRNKVTIKRTTFTPNVSAKKIAKKLNAEMAEAFKGTPNQDLIALQSPKVRELIEFGCQALKDDIEKLNESAFPVDIEGRYKSPASTLEKLADWSTREEKKGKKIPDYLAIRIVPQSEHSIFNAKGDKKLQKLIDEREINRVFIRQQYARLSEDMTFSEYCEMCEEVLSRISEQYPDEAETRKEMYKEKAETVHNNYQEYAELNGDADIPMSLDEILENTEIDIEDLLSELQQVNPNKCILYKLTKDVMNTFENSSLLKGLRIFNRV